MPTVLPQKVILTLLMLIPLIATSADDTSPELPQQTGNAQTAPDLHCSYEQYTAGQMPNEWSHAWGEQDDDLFLVSSDTASDGVMSVLFDRQTSENTRMWGALTPVATGSEGAEEICFDFLYSGLGNDVAFSFELRNTRAKRLADLNIGNSRAGFTLYRQGDIQGGSVRRIMNMQSEVWYRASMTFARQKNTDLPVFQLRLAKLSTWTAERELIPPVAEFTIAEAFPLPRLLYLNFGPNKRNFRVYFDNLKTHNNRGK